VRLIPVFEALAQRQVVPAPVLGLRLPQVPLLWTFLPGLAANLRAAG
jgi:hypothetical protein